MSPSKALRIDFQGRRATMPWVAPRKAKLKEINTVRSEIE